MSEMRQTSVPGWFATETGLLYSENAGAHIGMRYANKDGYLQTSRRDGGKVIKYDVHVLVCEAWHGPRPEGMQVDHIDGIKSNNHPSNLEWVTQEENMRRSRGADGRLGPK